MPTINPEADFLAVDNLQVVTVTNPDGATTSTRALQEGVDTIPYDLAGGGLGYRTYCTWHLWRADLSGFVPQFSTVVTDGDGRRWFAGAITAATWGTRYVLQCEAEAGQGVEEINPL